MEAMPRIQFVGKLRVWRHTARGKEYRRYVIVVPAPIGKLLDPGKEYKVIIEDPG